MGPIKYSGDIKAQSLKGIFRKNGWVSDKDNWNIFWGLPEKCKTFFERQKGCRLRDDQLINHFPNSYIISRKDFMPMMIRRYAKEMMQLGDLLPEIIPKTYILPREYPLFLQEYDKNEHAIWILKPCCKSQGYGIFLTQKLDVISKYGKRRRKSIYQAKADNKAYVICRYVDKPFLINGRKFDMRMYVLVTSFMPLKAYLFKDGFCRFSIHKYNVRHGLNDRFMHLTNHAVQRTNIKYNKFHGEKWSIKNLRLYLEGTLGLRPTNKLFNGINIIIVHSLKAAQLMISSNQHCFECFGYDIIIDENLKPWLVEVNSSPAIEADTKKDRILKERLISSVFSMVIPPEGKPDISWNKIPDQEAMENFIRLIDEDLYPWREEKYKRDRIRKNHLLLTKGHNSKLSLHSLNRNIQKENSSRNVHRKPCLKSKSYNNVFADEEMVNTKSRINKNKMNKGKRLLYDNIDREYSILSNIEHFQDLKFVHHCVGDN